MKLYKPDDIKDLSDVFYSVIGGKPESMGEIKAFLNTNDLNQLLSAADIEKVLTYGGYFPEEMVDAVYVLLPVKLSIKNNKTINLLPYNFRKMNKERAKTAGSRIINIDFHKAMVVHNLYYITKMQAVCRNKKKLQRENQKVRHPDTDKKSYKRRQAARTEEEKAEQREKKRLYARKYRAEHPKTEKSYYKKIDTLPLLEQINKRIDNRRRNKKYRQNNNEEIKARRNQQRATMKEKDPELIKALDRNHNAQESSKKAKQKYYQTHKAEVAQRAKNNPKSKVYKQRYKNKKRFQEKTGIPILSLLQGIINSKSK